MFCNILWNLFKFDQLKNCKWSQINPSHYIHIRRAKCWAVIKYILMVACKEALMLLLQIFVKL